MGVYLKNLHIKASSSRFVKEILQENVKDNYRVLPAKGGWITVCLNVDKVEEKEFVEINKILSKKLGVAIWGFDIYDSDILVFHLFDGGNLIAKFNSNPDYFGVATKIKRKYFSCSADQVKKYCQRGTSTKQLQRILKQKTIRDFADETEIDINNYVFEEQRLEELLSLIGIERKWAYTDYRDRDDRKNAENSCVDMDSFTERANQENKTDKGKFAYAVSWGETAKVKKYLSRGLNPNFKDILGLTPLMIAAENSRIETMKVLIENGANVNTVDDSGNTALHCAIECEDEDVIRLLLEVGADVYKKNRDGATPDSMIRSSESLDVLFSDLLKSLKKKSRKR